MPTGHVFIATSLDGFIARKDGSLDWLISSAHDREDHGYDAFMRDIDAIIMGRGTYEAVLTFDSWPYEKPVLVLSRQLAGTEPPEALRGRLTFSDLSPSAAMNDLGQRGASRVYVDGGQIVQSFLREGLVADIVVSRVPVLIGTGRSLFGTLDRDIKLNHLGTTSFPSGLVQSRYRVAG